MYTLYGKKGSGSAAIEAALMLAGAPYRFVETASWEQNDAYPALLALNPLGQVPTLVLEDGSAMSESAAILMYLGRAHPESHLLPADAAAGPVRGVAAHRRASRGGGSLRTVLAEVGQLTRR